jgi:hypothetical protein
MMLPGGDGGDDEPVSTAATCVRKCALRGAACHEAGHGVVALAPGLGVARIEIFGMEEDAMGE